MNELNGLLTGSITLLLWTVVIFGLGMYKPKWPLFFIKEPNRFMVVALTLILFMVAWTMKGEGEKQKRQEASAKEAAAQVAPAPEPVPVPVPTPEKPAK
ncbi:MAG: hypothetical protein NTY69_04550 [Methylococcales bacterium]|nr:hypothetical protein [Methylococcales bacterium]